jgi:UDP-glucose 4-epimerase
MRKSTSIKETVLLLGGTGFIGRNIIDYVHKNVELSSSYKFIILSRDLKTDIDDSAVYVSGDYADRNVLISLFSKWDFTKVFHCATSNTPISSINNIIGDINSNLIATIGLLDVMRDFGCSSIVYFSSGGAVYGDKKIDLISEAEICRPVSSYGVIKLTIENYLRLYQNQYGINYLILRISNPFGPFHTSDSQGIINIAVRRAVRKEVLEVWGDGIQTKDYIYVEDLVKIIFKLLNKKISNQTINIGSGKSMSINMLLEKIKFFVPSFQTKYIESKPSDVKNFCLDISLLNSIVDVEFTDFENSIIKTVLWETNQTDQ